jgi:hypothetical protein
VTLSFHCMPDSCVNISIPFLGQNFNEYITAIKIRKIFIKKIEPNM